MLLVLETLLTLLVEVEVFVLVLLAVLVTDDVLTVVLVLVVVPLLIEVLLFELVDELDVVDVVTTAQVPIKLTVTGEETPQSHDSPEGRVHLGLKNCMQNRSGVPSLRVVFLLNQSHPVCAPLQPGTSLLTPVHRALAVLLPASPRSIVPLRIITWISG